MRGLHVPRSGCATGGLLAVILLVTAACKPDGSNGSTSSHGCTGSQTVTAHRGDTLTILVENHVSGSYATQRVVDRVVQMNGIANRNVIHANQRYRLPTTCTVSQSTNISIRARSSHGCTGWQTVTVRRGDTLTVLVENHVSGSYATQQVVDLVVERNGIASRNVIHANRQYRLPTTCGDP
jgi:hypothetical protein